MITQSYSSPMLAEGIGAFTSQFKKGGMTKKNTKKKLSKREIEFIEAYANGGEVSNSDLFADGGKTIDAVWDDYRIADQYEGKKAEDIWFRLSPSQRRHLLTDHANIPNGGDLSAYVGDDVKFDDLEPFMKKILRKHFAEGQYAKGGKTKTKFSKGDKVFGKFRYEYGEGLHPVFLNEYSNIVSNGVISNVRKIDDTTMYEIDFENGEQLKYPDFAIEHFISKILFAKGGSIGSARTKGRESQNWEQELKEYAGENYNNLTAKEREEIISDMKKSYDKNYSYAKGGGLRKREEVYHESKYLTKEQWEKWNDYVKTGKINGKKENNIFTVARYIGVSVSRINGYEMEQKRKKLGNQYAKGGTTDPKPSAQDILKRLGYNIPEPEQQEEESKIIRGWVDDEPYYFAKGGMSKDDSPKVYIADLMEYNNGRLVGKWFDLTDYSNASELMQDIQAMLDEQTKKDPDGEVHEEWAVHDYENFPRAMYSEYMNEADFQKIIDVIQGAEDSNLPFDVILEAMSDLGVDEISEVVERYNGSVEASMGNEWRDFAYEFLENVGGIDGWSNADYYFDFESFGRDERINMGGEQEEEMGYEDLTNEQLGEQLVDEIGGISELDKSTIEMYFDYDKFGRDLQADFTAVRGEDGNYYFFDSNYKKGGKLKSKPDPKDDGEYELTEEDKKIIRGYVDDEPYYFAEGGEVTMEEKKKSLKGQPKLKF